MSAAKVGCSIGTMFTDIPAYADDIALLAPTAYVMRCMLSICESYAADFCVSFNASKSKCVICTSRRKPTETVYLWCSQFTINGNVIESVLSWPHLGHIITSNMDDASDIDRCRTKLICQINNVLCSLHQVYSIVKVNVLKSYCLSLYGCEL